MFTAGVVAPDQPVALGYLGRLPVPFEDPGAGHPLHGVSALGDGHRLSMGQIGPDQDPPILDVSPEDAEGVPMSSLDELL